MKNSSRFADEADMALVNMVRGGDQDAFGELWKRHAGAVSAAARSFTGFDPDDVTQETFYRILRRLQAGQGPATAFRAYAIMTARNVAANMARQRGSDDITGASDEMLEAFSQPQDDFAPRFLESSFTLSVFRSLPIRWQEALWYREVEDLPVQVFCAYLGMSENGTSALLKRAREGFKQAWIAANLSPTGGLDPDCRWVIERLPRYIRGKSTTSIRKKLEFHLGACPRCAIVVEESEVLQSRLALVLLPAFLGSTSGAAYLEWIRSDKANEGIGQPRISGPPGRAARVVKLGLIPTAAVLAGSIGGAYAFMTLADVPDTQQAPPTTLLGSESETSTATSATESDGSGLARKPQVASKVTPPTSTSSAGYGALPPTPKTPEEQVPLPTPTSPSTPRPRPSPAPASPIRVPSTLTAAPADGVEVGVYPRLVGTGVAGGTVALTVANDLGEQATAQIPVASDGTWQYTPSALRGTLTVTASQTYQRDGAQYVEGSTTLGTFQVGDGLRMTITATAPNESTIKITGFGPLSKNQRGNARSSILGPLVTKRTPDASNEVIAVVPYSRTSLGNVRFWQGDTSTGPYRVWRLAPTP